MTDQKINDVTPDTLMQRFQGSGLKTIIVFTLVVHVVVLLGSSVPFLVKKVLGANTSAMTQEDRVKAAVQEATVAIRKIAGDYGLNPQDISDRFATGGSRAAVVAPEEAVPAATDEEAAEEPERPKSEIEKALEVQAEGPAVPRIDDDIF
jgi:hypothetical protein